MQNLILESAVRASLIAMCTAAVLFILRVKAARERHAVWASVVVLMLVLPVWTAWGPRAVVRVLRPAAAPTINRSVTSTEVFSGQAMAGELPKAQVQGIVWTWRSLLAAVYLLGFFALLARLGIGTVRAHRLMRRAANRAGRLTSDACAAPITVGWLHPTVLLPEWWTRWPQAQLSAVLTHEDEHARRRDPLVQWVALLNRAIFWFHPLAWWLERRLSALAEEACDAAVLARGHDPIGYSEYLLEMARVVRQSGARVNVVGMAMPGTFLPQRIRRILEGAPAQRISRLRMVGVAVACAVISTVFMAGAVAVTSSKVQVGVAPVGKPTTVEPTSPEPQPRRAKVLLAQVQTRAARPNPTSSGSGSVSGTVEDPSGARVPRECVITARDQTGVSVDVAHSDAAGYYRLASLPAGHYNLEFTAPGFARKTVQMEIEAGKAARVDAMLDLGSVHERMTITGQKPAALARSTAEPAKPARIRIGGNVQPLRLLEQTKPVYALELQQQGIEGTVLIRAVISREGVPLNPHALNNDVDPRLVQAALDSVRQWRYQPSLLNGQPVETATTVTVEFRLGE